MYLLHQISIQFTSYPFVKSKSTIVKDQLYVGNQIYNPDTDKLEFPRHRSASHQPVEPRVPSRPGNRARDGGRGPAWQHVLDFRTPNRFKALTSDPEGVGQQRRKPVCERSPPTPLDETPSKWCRDDPSSDDLPPLEQEGPEGPGTLTWEWRFLRVSFFIA